MSSYSCRCVCPMVNNKRRTPRVWTNTIDKTCSWNKSNCLVVPLQLVILLLQYWWICNKKGIVRIFYDDYTGHPMLLPFISSLSGVIRNSVEMASHFVVFLVDPEKLYIKRNLNDGVLSFTHQTKLSKGKGSQTNEKTDTLFELANVASAFDVSCRLQSSNRKLLFWPRSGCTQSSSKIASKDIAYHSRKRCYKLSWSALLSYPCYLIELTADAW